MSAPVPAPLLALVPSLLSASRRRVCIDLRHSITHGITNPLSKNMYTNTTDREEEEEKRRRDNLNIRNQRKSEDEKK